MNKQLAAQIAYGHCPVDFDLQQELNRTDKHDARHDAIEQKFIEINENVDLWNEAISEYAFNDSPNRTKLYELHLYRAVRKESDYLIHFCDAAVWWYARKLVGEND